MSGEVEEVKKSLMIWIAAVLLVCMAGIGTTVAYFTNTSQVVNRLSFIGENGMDAVLTEPSWDPQKGLKLIPGMTAAKDPQVTNTSQIDLDLLVALKVEFIYGADCPDPSKTGSVLSEEDMAYVCDVFEIDWNADDPEQSEWIRFDGEDSCAPVQQFYYSEVLKRNLPQKGDTTAALFTRLSIPEEVDNSRYSHIREIGGFDIRISGRILQQMEGDQEFGLGSAEEAYDAGLFDFE